MTLKIIGIGLIVLLTALFLFTRSKGISPLAWNLHKPVYQSKAVAIKGYDPVAYLENNKAVPGNPAFTTEWKGSQWQFTSEEHKTAFLADPEAFAPAFGGYCAFAASKGFTANPDPQSWEINNGKLYLFADDKVRASWKEQLPEIIETAEGKWKE